MTESLVPFLTDDQPILVAPSGDCEISDANTELYRPVCLACFKSLNVRISTALCVCSRCQWPMCNFICEQDEIHSSLECKIFRKLAIPPSCYVLKSIFILRAVLMQEKFPDRWERLMKLQHEFSISAKNDDPVLNSIYDLSTKFIRDYCKMEHINSTLIKRIVNLKIINSLHISKSGSTPGESYYGIAIFESLSAVFHSCCPTVEWTIFPRTRSANTTLYLTAIRQPNKIESVVSIAKDKTCLLFGTRKRQRILQERYGINCQCSRCSDPTENGSYFSALLCQVCLSSSSNNLNKNKVAALLYQPDSTLWKCINCQMVRNDSEVQEIVSNAEKDLDEILDSLYEDEVVAKMLEKFLQKFAGTILHQNHYLLIEAKRNWMESHSIMRKIGIPGKEANQLYNMLKYMAQHCLKVYSMVLSSPHLEPVMMMHYKLANANKIFYKHLYNDKENYGLSKYFFPSREDILKQKTQERRNILEKALAAHSFDTLPKSPFTIFRELELLKQKKTFMMFN